MTIHKSLHLLLFPALYIGPVLNQKKTIPGALKETISIENMSSISQDKEMFEEITCVSINRKSEQNKCQLWLEVNLCMFFLLLVCTFCICIAIGDPITNRGGLGFY